MPSLFPDLLSYSMLGIFAIRSILGITLISLGYLESKDSVSTQKILGYSNIVAGVLIIVGIATQIGALLASVTLGILLVQKIIKKQFLTQGINYYLILFVLSLAILVLGPGSFAFDLPL